MVSSTDVSRNDAQAHSTSAMATSVCIINIFHFPPTNESLYVCPVSASRIQNGKKCLYVDKLVYLIGIYVCMYTNKYPGIFPVYYSNIKDNHYVAKNDIYCSVYICLYIYGKGVEHFHVHAFPFVRIYQTRTCL